MFIRSSLLHVTLCAVFMGGGARVSTAQQTAPAPASEQILSYDSDLAVNSDGTLVVRETIMVFAMGVQIKHGIARDILTRYQDRLGNSHMIHIDGFAVTRDGQPEHLHLAKLPNGLRIAMGSSSEILSPGQHTYELTYEADRELGFFPDYDELYWNVTGGGWSFPIQQASATVHLPRGIAQEAIMPDAYTGRPGSAGTDFTASADNQSNVTFHTARVLSPHEGLSIVARWPKGFVHPPTDDQQWRFFLEDNQASLIGLVGLLPVLVFYTAAWFLAGRNPGGEIVPVAEPPRGFSPGALRGIWRAAFDQKAMVANIVDLAVKKRLAILEHSSGAYILGRVQPGAPTGAPQAATSDSSTQITRDEKLVLDKLFAGGDTLRLASAQQPIVGGAIEALQHRLRADLERAYFLANGRYLIPGLLISIAILVRSGFSIQGAPRLLVAVLAVGLLLWSLDCLSVAALAGAAGGNALSDPLYAPAARKQARVMSAILLLFLAGEVAGVWVMAWAASRGVVVTLLLLAAINYAFHVLLKSPTRRGRALMDQIECFRLYLTSAQRPSPDARALLPEPAQLYEKLLPYAMALNVEKGWSEQFTAAWAHAAQTGTAAYSPGWYTGPAWNAITAATFATSLGNSLTSALSSTLRQ